MRQDILSDFTVSVVPKLVDEAAEAIPSIVQTLEMLVGVFGCLGRLLLGVGKLLFTSVQHVAINLCPFRLEVLHLSNVGQNNIYSLDRLKGAFTLTAKIGPFSP